jgi:phospholipase/lecithinase/hemolysin
MNVMTNTRHRSTNWTGRTIGTCLALALGIPGLATAQSRFSQVVVFGTSLSDPGNAFVLVGDQSTPPDFLLNPLLIPSAPYAKGGHHFSNGATWIEQFARAVGLGGSVKPALGSFSAGALNFAVGAARAYDDGNNFNLTRQVQTFLERSGGVAPAGALYVIEMGSNDVRDAFALYATGGNGGPIIMQALGSIAANIGRLHAAGAREFLVWVAPNVALTPAIRSLGPGAGGLALQVTQAFNGGLTQTLGQLAGALPGTSFLRLDAYRLLNEIVAQPATFGLTNATSACVTPGAVPFNCAAPDGYLFWDGIHPTAAGHAILAGEAARVLR